MSPLSSPSFRLWPALILCLGTVATACGAEQAGAARSEAAPGPLLCEEPEVDFGATWEGTILRHSFALEVGEKPLRILKAETDCGCTLTNIQRAGQPYELGQELAPGSQLVLGVEVNTRGKRGRTPRKVNLLFQGASGTPERMPLTVHSDIRPWLVAEPASMAPLTTSEGEAVETSFVVRQSEGEAFALSALRKGLPPWVQVEVVPMGGDGVRAREHAVTVRFDATAPRGIRGYGVRLEADRRNPLGFVDPESGERPSFALLQEVSIDVRGPVGLRPPSLTFGVVRPGQIVSRTVRVESHDPGFTLAEPRALLKPLGGDGPFYLGDCASIRARDAGNGAWDVEVTLAELDSRIQGNFFARLVIETGHPDLPELEASLMGVAVAGAPSAPRAGGGQ